MSSMGDLFIAVYTGGLLTGICLAILATLMPD